MPPCPSRRRNVGNSRNGSTGIETTSTADTRTGSAPIESRSAGRYRGRFAPSPTGPLHLGSLVAATASYLQARAAEGAWLLRIEDIDPPREIAGAADAIVACLDAHGFRWSGEVRYQSRRTGAHEAAVVHLAREGLAYRCACSRKEIRAAGILGPAGPVYPGTCRNHPPPATAQSTAWRARTAPCRVAYQDALQGQLVGRIDRQIGDFVVRRRDGLIAYVLAGALDDHAEGITEVVRGADLLAITPAQIWIQRLLGLDRPSYLHVPVMLATDGQKLSKQTGAMPLEHGQAAANLWQALRFLGQFPPVDLQRATPADVWDWAVPNWRPERLRDAAYPSPAPVIKLE